MMIYVKRIGVGWNSTYMISYEPFLSRLGMDKEIKLAGLLPPFWWQSTCVLFQQAVLLVDP